MGTGVVTSVPSDAPADYIGLQDLKKNETSKVKALRAKYKITDEMVAFDPVPIIDIPGFGNLIAVKVCEDMGITNQHEEEKLEEAKDVCYGKANSVGVMSIGSQKGKKVPEAQNMVRDELIEQGLAATYSEPDGLIVSRSGDDCVVALCDQWFLAYGEPEWRAEVEAHLGDLECYSDETKRDFEATLAWLHEHACSRTYGLGSRLPWDESWLIESLSDSTIYMAYYTIAHLLHGGTLDGSGESPLGIKAEDMTREVWDFVFLGKAVSAKCPVSQDKLDTMRNEFMFLYPMDLRVSGKDLIPNHLTYCLYNHAAIFPKEHWPRSIRANGHLQLNGEKMSKSTGNFKTLRQSIEEYSADVSRLCLADAGDSMEDANFEEKNANSSILTLNKELDWTSEVMNALPEMRRGDMSTFADKCFLAAINNAIAVTDGHYEKMMYREAVKTGFNELLIARDTYRDWCKLTDVGMHRDLAVHYIKVQWIIMAPIVPHIAERMWTLLGNKGSVMSAVWPQAPPADYVMLAASKYIDSVAHLLRKGIEKSAKAKANKDKGPAKGVTIYYAAEYPLWQRAVLAHLASVYDDANNDFPTNREILPVLKGLPELSDKKVFKGVMPFVAYVRKAMETVGKAALATVVPFNEAEVLQQNSEYFKKTLKINSVDVLEIKSCTTQKMVDVCKPGNPELQFTF